ncbi:hypothetical protein PGTUg99_020026 [Puccinia graminis f. sp. tritici]|uniref:Uncharacterized protein n=1 Tax=Puccinia graminis f. sp. tritici TaxID=56615 RepID=A0A5B0MTA3_PUCGR|nr:hypothetical protein PGTUg99_020026 [Puccinia graminis f. sp. tritici]
MLLAGPRPDGIWYIRLGVRMPSTTPGGVEGAAEDQVGPPCEFQAKLVKLSDRSAELQARLELEDLQWMMFRNWVNKASLNLGARYPMHNTGRSRLLGN